jgi:hypothetical protein
MRNAPERPVRKARGIRASFLVIPALALTALVSAAAIVATPATAHPSYGQPCSRCHTQTATATVTLKLSAAKVHPGAVVAASGTVPADHNWTKVTIQKRLGTKPWKAWKTVTITSTSSFSAKWTAAATKGKYSFRAIYAGDNNYKKSISPVRTVTVY